MKKVLATFLMCHVLALSAPGSEGTASFAYRRYSPAGELTGLVHSCACPALFDWDGDGLLDLLVGEKTADEKGKVRIYLNRGTSSAPKFADFTYLQKNGADIEFTGKGCIGLQVSFGKAKGATMFISTAQGDIYGWEHDGRNPETNEQVEWRQWFSHFIDARFCGLIRSCTSCADMDGDGYDEVIVSGQNCPIFWIKRVGEGDDAKSICMPMLDGAGKYIEYPEGQSHASAVMLNVTDDDIQDIVTGDTDGNVWAYAGLGNGRFAASPVRLYENSSKSIKRSRLAVGDIDGDGIQDLLVGRKNGSILILRGEPDFAP